MPIHSDSHFYRKRLPHWEVQGALYFVTVRLRGSIPKHAEADIRHLSQRLATCAYSDRLRLQRHIFRLMERWLDHIPPDDQSVLIRPDMAHMVQEAIHFRIINGIWKVAEYVIMPNHLHMLIQICAVIEKMVTANRGALEIVMEAFKRWTGKKPVAFWNRAQGDSGTGSGSTTGAGIWTRNLGFGDTFKTTR